MGDNKMLYDDMTEHNKYEAIIKNTSGRKVNYNNYI